MTSAEISEVRSPLVADMMRLVIMGARLLSKLWIGDGRNGWM